MSARQSAATDRRMKRASYREGVAWIAMNDNAGNHDNVGEVEGYISTAMLADLFGVDCGRVARDVMRVRSKEDL